LKTEAAGFSKFWYPSTCHSVPENFKLPLFGAMVSSCKYVQSYFKDYILWIHQKKHNVNYITYTLINNLTYLTCTLHIHYVSSDESINVMYVMLMWAGMAQSV
jgi:hypothetical protein